MSSRRKGKARRKVADLKIPEINSVTLSGHLGGDPELRYTPSGKAVCEFSLAVDSRRRGEGGKWETETSWFRVECWEKVAEWVAQDLKKGAPVIIEGKLSTNEWVDKDSGKKQSKTRVVARRVQSLVWPDDGSQRDTPPPQRERPEQTETVIQDDIPF